MKRFFKLSALLVCVCAGARLLAADMQSSIHAAFAEMRGLRNMAPLLSYRVEVHGKVETGFKENFLRRRTSAEILKSRLSSGCGDYAVVFQSLMRKRGYEAWIVDGAEVSTESLEHYFSGHAVVALRENGRGKWWLVNSTDRKVMSKDWSIGSPYFKAYDRYFRIGYCGPLERYPVHNNTELRSFYTATLKKVPQSFLNEHIVRLKLTVDPSLRGADGEYLNPNVARFLTLQFKILAANDVHPRREIAVRLVLGKEDHVENMTQDSEGRLLGVIGKGSGCTSSLITYFEVVGAKLLGY